MAGLVVVGTLLVDEVLTLATEPGPGSQQRALDRRVTGGGQVWHTTLAAAWAGASVTAFGRRGDDEEGDRLASLLVRTGVVDRLVPQGASRRAVVLLSPAGERTIVSLPEVDPPALRVPESRITATVGEADWVHLDGYALDEVTGDVALAAARAASAAGIPLSLEPPSTAGLPARRDRLAALPPLALVSGRPDEIVATIELLTSQPTVVVTHDGPAPVTWTTAGGSVEVEVLDTGAVATLGAGDRFTGGLLAASLRGADAAAALHAGVDAAFARPPV